MKKIIFLLLLLLPLSHCKAQEATKRLGFEGGLTFSDLLFDDLEEELNPRLSSGYSLGLNFNHSNSTNKYSFQTGVLFSSYAYKTNPTFSASTTAGISGSSGQGIEDDVLISFGGDNSGKTISRHYFIEIPFRFVGASLFSIESLKPVFGVSLQHLTSVKRKYVNYRNGEKEVEYETEDLNELRLRRFNLQPEIGLRIIPIEKLSENFYVYPCFSVQALGVPKTKAKPLIVSFQCRAAWIL